MTESMIMLVYNDDYADEFTVAGFAFLRLDDWEYIKREADATEFPREIYFGTNEFMEYDNAQEFIRAFKIKMVSVEDITEMKRMFYMDRPKENLFGICPYHGCEGSASKEFYEKEGARLL